jgi:RNA polymerase sigma-70 factor (ECF subfamily)
MTATMTHACIQVLHRPAHVSRSSHAATESAATATAVASAPSDRQPDVLSPRDFETFVAQYGDRLLNVARKFLRNEDDAMEAVQDALLSAHTSLHSFQGKSTVYTWLYRIVVNSCLMKLRSQRRYQDVFGPEWLPGLADCDRLGRTTWERTGDRLEREEMRTAVRNCIDLLPDDYRTIILLRDIEELDTDETAARLRISSGAVKTRLHRARQALRGLLEDAHIV